MLSFIIFKFFAAIDPREVWEHAELQTKQEGSGYRQTVEANRRGESSESRRINRRDQTPLLISSTALAVSGQSNYMSVIFFIFIFFFCILFLQMRNYQIWDLIENLCIDFILTLV